MNPKCEFCGTTENLQQSHLSPMGFIVMKRSQGYSHYEKFWYCGEHYQENVNSFWNRVGSRIP